MNMYQLRAEVINNLDAFASKVTPYAVDGWINSAYRDLISKLDITQTSLTSTTVSGTESIDLSGTALNNQLRNIKRVTLTDGSTVYRLAARTFNDRDFLTSGSIPSSSTRPDFYYHWNNTLYFYPTPNSNYPIEIWYLDTNQATALTVGDTITNIPDFVQPLIVLAATSSGKARFGDYEGAGYFMELYNAQVEEAKNELTRINRDYPMFVRDVDAYGADQW